MNKDPKVEIVNITPIGGEQDFTISIEDITVISQDTRDDVIINTSKSHSFRGGDKLVLRCLCPPGTGAIFARNVLLSGANNHTRPIN